MKHFQCMIPKLLILSLLVICLLTPLASCGECDHQWGDWTVSTKPTCEEDGAQTRACSACGETQTETLKAEGHHFVTYKANGDATCIGDMTETATCEHCDKTDTRTVANSKDPKKHTATDLRYAPATEESHDLLHVCCGAVERSEAHRWDNGATDPKNTQNTLYTCLDCRATKSVAPQEHIHRAQRIEAKPAGCSTWGNIEYWYCESCNTRYADAALTRAISESDTKLAPGHTSTTFVYAPHATDPNLHEKRYACCNALVETAAHSYEQGSSHPATCTQNGYVVYRCVCGDSYQTDNAAAAGHNVEFWDLDRETRKTGTTCTYNQTYVGTCFTCSQPVEKTVEIIRHSYTATITAHPTCCEEGSKTYACSCGATPTVATVTIEADPSAHHWNNGVTEGGVTTYTCLNECGTTKTAVVYTEPTQDVDKSVLEDNEIVLGGVSLKLNDATLDLLDSDPTKKVTVTANPVSDRDALINTLPEALRGQINANTPIYDFSLSQGGVPIRQFGDNGRITITLPYELPTDADADCVAVWYVNGAGELSFYEATYYEADGEGFVIFEASHFSTYLPGVAPTQNACELYGHNYEEKITSPTCDTKGYTEYHCQRCGESKIDDVTDALGHAYDSGEGTESTCMVAGKMTYSCTRDGCDHTIDKTLALTPHTWQFVESESTPVSCTQDGVAVYRCSVSGCDGIKTEYESSWGGHDLYDSSAALADGVTNCTDGVVVTVKCHLCDYTEQETRTGSHIRIDKLGYDEFGYMMIPESKIMLGAYLQEAGIAYTNEPFIILTHGCFCGEVKDRVSMFNGMDQNGSEIFSGWVDFSSTSVWEDSVIVSTIPNTVWDPILDMPVESPVFKIFFQSVITRVDCHETFSVTIKIGYNESTGEALETMTYVLNEYDWHKNTKTTATIDDPNKTCYESSPVVDGNWIMGIHVTESCLDCNTVLQSFDTAVGTSSSHYFYPAEVYEYKDNDCDDGYYGLRVFINECPCGQTEYSLHKGDCSFSRTSVGNTDIYVCDDCGFIYAEKTEEIEDEENCHYSYTEYLYLDCASVNNVTDCEKTVICRIIDEERHYDVTYEDNEDDPTPTDTPCLYSVYYRSTCNKCGEITDFAEGYQMIHDESTTTTTDSRGNVTTTVTCRAEGCGYTNIQVKDKNDNVLRNYYVEKDYDEEYLVIALETFKIINGQTLPTLYRAEGYSLDGEELLVWTQVSYSYRNDPEKGCICTIAYSSSMGYDGIEEDFFCVLGEEIFTQELTCDQDGYSYQICQICGRKEYLYYEETRGHEFQDGSCWRCGEPCVHEFDGDGWCYICYMMCPHAWDNGVCVECGTTCPHGWYNDQGFCDRCGKSCEHEYNEDGRCIMCGMECDHTWNNSVCETCSAHCRHEWFDENEICGVCGMPCTHEFRDGCCIYCYKPCEHTWENGKCTVCCATCGHSWNNGVCIDCEATCEHESYSEWGWCNTCGKECEHSWTHNEEYSTCGVCRQECHHFWNWEGKCDICFKQCEHEYDKYGYCHKCGMMCDHTWENGVCSKCHVTCTHSWDQGCCYNCGMTCEHKYDEYGWCPICYKQCEHMMGWDDQSRCLECGAKCPHGYYHDGFCAMCYAPCEHSYLYGNSCDNCGKPCDHPHWEHGVCSLCGMPCSHDYGNNGFCFFCQEECPHDFTRGYCPNCGTPCPHEDAYFNGEPCGICGAYQ